MKKLLALCVTFAALTGCSPNTTHGNATPSPLTNATGVNITAANANNPNGNSAPSAIDNATMSKNASELIQRYVDSHNDSSLATYKVDVEQFFAPGLAAAVGTTAVSGTDFNHPVQSSSTQMLKLQAVNVKQFQATARIEIKYKDGQTTNQIYHLAIVNFNSHWIIKTIA